MNNSKRHEELKQAIRAELGKHGRVRIFVNNVGTAFRKRRGDPKLYPIKFGLCTGSSDLIGIRAVEITPDMVGKTIGKSVDKGEMPVYVGRFGDSLEEVFITGPELKRKFGEKFDEIPAGALGVYTYTERLAQGIRQLMCGNRKFALEHITRDDIASLTKEAAEISSIPHVMDTDKSVVDKILSS